MTDIIVHVPEKYKHLAEAFKEVVDEVIRNVDSAERGKVAAYDKIEKAVGKHTREIERASHEAILSALDINASSVEIEGVLHRRVGRSRRFAGQLGSGRHSRRR